MAAIAREGVQSVDRRDVPVIETSKETRINEKVAQVYAYVAGGFGITCVTAAVFAWAGLAVSVMTIGSALFLTVVGVSLLFAMKVTSQKDNSWLKHGLYGMLSVWGGVVVSPLVLVNAPVFFAAAATTVALTGGLGIMAMHLKESFAQYERILMVALGAITLASFGALVLPAGAAAFAHEVSLIGGFAVFGALVVYDSHQAREDALNEDFDVINHAAEIYLDAANLLVRIWEIYERNR